MWLGIQMHVSFFLFLKKIANPLTFSAVRRLYGTDRFEKKNRFCTESVNNGLIVRFEPVSSVTRSDQPVLPVLVTLVDIPFSG
jgi:hypothetical protein